MEIDIDSWPMIPTYMEIEGISEKEVLDKLKLLGVDESRVTTLNRGDIYAKIYRIDIDKINKVLGNIKNRSRFVLQNCS